MNTVKQLITITRITASHDIGVLKAFEKFFI
jgi:hypothetical protein